MYIVAIQTDPLELHLGICCSLSLAQTCLSSREAFQFRNRRNPTCAGLSISLPSLSKLRIRFPQPLCEPRPTFGHDFSTQFVVWGYIFRTGCKCLYQCLKRVPVVPVTKPLRHHMFDTFSGRFKPANQLFPKRNSLLHTSCHWFVELLNPQSIDRFARKRAVVVCVMLPVVVKPDGCMGPLEYVRKDRTDNGLRIHAQGST